MKRYTLVVLLILFHISTEAQVFNTLFNNVNSISLNQGNLRINVLQTDGKIYYTMDTGSPSEGASILCVVDSNGKNGKQLPQTRMVGSNFLAATESYIYYNSYNSTYDIYYIYRLNKKTEKVEEIITEDSGNRWPYATGITKMFAKMYTYKDKLVLAGFYKVNNSPMPGRSLCVIEDKSPYARLLSTVNLTSKDPGISTNFYLTKDEIAITDTIVYSYNYYPENQEKKICYYLKNFKGNSKPYGGFGEITLLKSGYVPIENKLVSTSDRIYSLIKKTNTDSAYVMEIKGQNGNRVGQTFELNSDNVFMKVYDNNIFFGDRMHLYKYDTLKKEVITIIQLKKDPAELLYGIGLIQNQDFLLRGNDGIVYFAINTFKDVGASTKKYGSKKIVAVHPDNSIETVCTINDINCSRTNYEPDFNASFIIGKSLYTIHNDYNNNTQWLEKYSKENNWKPIRIDYPAIKNFNPYFDYSNAPKVFQLSDRLLVNVLYKNSNNTKETQMMYLFTE